MAEAIQIVRMGRGDIPFGMKLKELAGWNQLPVDWERFLESEPEGCFVAYYEGRPAGTATTIAYEKLFGWIGMILVHPELRRRGIGTALLQASLDYLEQKGVAAVKLDATPMGKKLYDTMGFVDEYRLERWEGKGRLGSWPEGVRELTLADADMLEEFDRPIFGADRRRVLQRLLTEPTVRVAGDFYKGALQGYAAIRPGARAMYLGPWIAREAETAERLFQWSLVMAAKAPLYVDVLLPCPFALPIVQAAGFVMQRYFIRMYRGANVSPGQPQFQCGILGPETG